ncbi:MAG: 5-oxoprolinase subunit PxpA [Pseudomonadota bacterium]
MMASVDLNADMGESFGPWVMGNDEALLAIVSSANIACGFHAGDPDVMETTMKAAALRGVGIGAHPGFDDLQGFGRRRITLPPATLTNLITYQIGAAQALAASVGSEVRHVKLHGAMSNMAGEDEAMALTCFEAIVSAAPQSTIMILPGTAHETATRKLGCKVACEIFADRAYNDDGSLVDRSLPGAVIDDPHAAAERTVAMVKAGAIRSQSGKLIPVRIDTICCHGDTPGAVDVAKAVRRGLEAEGMTVQKLRGAPL